MSFLMMMGNTENNINSVFGNTDTKSFNIDINSIDQQQLQIFEDYLLVTGKNTTVSIINSPYNFENLNYVINSGVSLDFIEIDYSLLSPNEKSKIDNFVNFLIS